MNDIARLDTKINTLVDRLNTLVEQKRNPQFIKLEFKRFVQLVTEKHELLLNRLLEKKFTMNPNEYELHKQNIAQQYKAYIITMAVLIDQELAST